MAVVTNTERSSEQWQPLSLALSLWQVRRSSLTQSISLSTAPVGSQWFILVALTLLTGSFTIAMSSLSVRVSVSETFVFASVLMFGTAAGTVTVVLETLVMSFLAAATESSSAACPVQCCRACRRDLGFQGPSSIGSPASHRIFDTPLLCQCSSCHWRCLRLSISLLNTWLVALAVALHKNQSPLRNMVATVHLALGELLQRRIGGSADCHLQPQHRHQHAPDHCSRSRHLVPHVSNCDGPCRRRYQALWSAERLVLVDHRNAGDGDRCQRSDHARPH